MRHIVPTLKTSTIHIWPGQSLKYHRIPEGTTLIMHNERIQGVPDNAENHNLGNGYNVAVSIVYHDDGTIVVTPLGDIGPYSSYDQV